MFKEGDKVRIKSLYNTWGYIPQNIVLNGVYVLKEHVKTNNSNEYYWNFSEPLKWAFEYQIELVEEWSKNNSVNHNFMSNIKEFFRGLTATEDEKLLKEIGVEDPIGIPTSLGLELSAEMQYKANREAIIEIAKKMKEATDKEKK